MKILHNKRTNLHNADDVVEGVYRFRDFEETINDLEIQDLYNDSEKFIELVHPKNYIDKIKNACELGLEIAEVRLSPGSYEAMLVSAALSILAVKNNDFAVVRPAGHHASTNKAEGFCFFNNVAIATSYLLNQNKKVFIIDIDGHHGNGTENILKNMDGVFFSSIHQMATYPNSGSLEDRNNDLGFRKMINIPLRNGTGDDYFLKSLELILNYAKKFNPDHIVVSAGFDGYYKDKILGLNYSEKGYYEAGKMIASLSKPISAILEGGYHEDLKLCVSSFVDGVSGNEFDGVCELSKSYDAASSHASAILKHTASLL